eukprot:7816894-Alexandrium_andersonii.AAC.1
MPRRRITGWGRSRYWWPMPPWTVIMPRRGIIGWGRSRVWWPIPPWAVINCKSVTDNMWPGRFW